MSRAHLSLVALACFTVCAGAALAQDNTKKIITSNPPPTTAGPALPRIVYAPLLRSPELPYAELALNNRSPQPTVATLTFHTKSGEPWQAPPITIAAGEVKHINLDDVLPDELRF